MKAQMMYVKDYMQAIVITVSPNDLLSTARRTMDELFIRHLPVVSQGCLVGILTDRDIRRIVALSQAQLPSDTEGNEALCRLCVRQAMTRQPYTVSPDTVLIEAAAVLLEHKFDCLPVVDEEGILKGLLTVSDFVRIYLEQHDNVIY